MENKTDETNNIEIPELVCEGCKNRDKIIKRFAEHIDKQNEQIECLKKEFLDATQREMELAA